jgi:hypothetical protein
LPDHDPAERAHAALKIPNVGVERRTIGGRYKDGNSGDGDCRPV